MCGHQIMFWFCHQKFLRELCLASKQKGRRVGFITVMEAVVIVFHLHEWSGKQWRRKFGDDKNTDLTQIIINNNLAS